MQRRLRTAWRNEGLSNTPSARALFSLWPMLGSFAHDGTRPQRISSATRSPSRVS